MKTKSKLTGDNLIAYEGRCARCQGKEVAYYIFAGAHQKERMKDGTILNYKYNCPKCVTSRVLQTPNTMEFYRRLQPEEADTNLEILQRGNNINFDAVINEGNEMLKQDKVVEEWAMRGEEALNRAKSGKRTFSV